MNLFSDQIQALETAKQSKVFILTGPPGTGKTTVAKEILDYYEAQGARCALAAPSGKAAKRMFECTGRSASTIHRLLEPQRVGNRFIFTRNAENPIQANLILIDEGSMIDTTLMSSLMEAVAPGSKLRKCQKISFTNGIIGYKMFICIPKPLSDTNINSFCPISMSGNSVYCWRRRPSVMGMEEFLKSIEHRGFQGLEYIKA